MKFDEIMRASGLDPNDPSTFWLIHFDDMDLRAFSCGDLLEAAGGRVELERREEVSPWYINLLAFIAEVGARVNDRGRQKFRRDEPASCLQKSTQGRVVQ